MYVQRRSLEKNLCDNTQHSSSSSSSSNPLTLQWGELEGRFASLQSSIEARLKELEIKEAIVNDRLRELESKEKQTSMKPTRNVVQLDFGRKHTDWKKQLTLLGESMVGQEEVFECVYQALDFSEEPGKFVLDAVRELCCDENVELGSVSSCSSSSSVGKRICAALLEQLARLAPGKIGFGVKMEALESARGWRAKIGTEKKGAEGVLEVMVFLLFLGAFDLVDEFDTGDVLRSVFQGVEKQDNSGVELGFADENRETTGRSFEENLELVNQIASAFTSPFEALKCFCVGMNGRNLKLFLYKYVDENDSWTTFVRDALGHAQDPAKLVLDAIPGFVHSRPDEFHRNLSIAKVRKICILLLEQLITTSTQVSPNVREEALKLADEWGSNLGQIHKSPVTAFGFLLFLAAYGLKTKYKVDELVRLLEVASRYKASPVLCQALGLEDRVEVIVHNLIQKGMLLDAVDYVYAYNLVGKFQPVHLLKTYLNRSLNRIHKKGSSSSSQQVMDKEIAVRRTIIRYIAKYKLESYYLREDQEKQILELEKRKAQANSAQMKRPKAYQKSNLLNPSLSPANSSVDSQVKASPKANLESNNQEKFKPTPKEDVKLDSQATKPGPSPKEDSQLKDQVAKTQVSLKQDSQSDTQTVSPKEDLRTGNQAPSSPTILLSNLKSLYTSIYGEGLNFFSNKPKEKLDSEARSSTTSLWPELKSFCVNMDGKGLGMFLYDHMGEHDLLCNEVCDALKHAADPSKLVLDAMPGFLCSQPEFDKSLLLNKVRNSRILLLEQLIAISPQETSHCAKELARKMANEWRANLGQKYQASANVYGFLNFVAVYGLASEYNAEELLGLLLLANHHKSCPHLCQILGLEDKVAVLIENLIQKTLLLEAIEHIYAFEVVDKFPPVRLLKDYLYSQKTVFNNRIKSPSKHAIDKEIAAARNVVKCIAKYKLESQYQPKDLEKHIAELEKQRARMNDIFAGKS